MPDFLSEFSFLQDQILRFASITRLRFFAKSVVIAQTFTFPQKSDIVDPVRILGKNIDASSEERLIKKLENAAFPCYLAGLPRKTEFP